MDLFEQSFGLGRAEFVEFAEREAAGDRGKVAAQSLLISVNARDNRGEYEGDR
jgi:hypothetical protein